MTDTHAPTYGTAALETLRRAVATEARRLPAAADAVTVLPGTALGPLASGPALLGVLGELAKALDTDLAAGGARLSALDRELDTGLTAMQGADTHAADGLRGCAGAGG